MDSIDYKYRDSIREALQYGGVNKLMQFVPGLTEKEASDYIDSWKLNYLQTMEKIRNSEDTSALDEQTHEILRDLMSKANLSGYDENTYGGRSY